MKGEFKMLVVMLQICAIAYLGDKKQYISKTLSKISLKITRLYCTPKNFI